MGNPPPKCRYLRHFKDTVARPFFGSGLHPVAGAYGDIVAALSELKHGPNEREGAVSLDRRTGGNVVKENVYVSAPDVATLMKRMTSSVVAARAVSPANRRLPASRNSLDQP